MSEPKSVIVSRAEADAALATRGELPFQHLQRRFREEHGLEFTVGQLAEGVGFKFESESHDRAFRVTYLGDGEKHEQS